MAAMEECSTLEPSERVSAAAMKDFDSGVDDSSESDRSCDDERSAVFSSIESLDCETPEKVNYEHIGTSILPDTKRETENCDSCNRLDVKLNLKKEENIAVLEVEPPCILEPNKNDDDDINYDLLPDYFKLYKEGEKIPADFDVSQDIKPDWYDEEKFRRGQKFAMDHAFCINFAETLSLLLIFSVKTALSPLIFTGKSSSPYAANRRYLSTAERLKSWYTCDPFDKNSVSYRNIRAVTTLHRSVRDKLAKMSPEEIEKTCNVGNEKCPAVWSTSRHVLIDDFRSSCPVPAVDLNPKPNGRVWFNQVDMSATQFAFVGMAVTFPTWFGMVNATEEDLDAFVYTWRVLGYLMGIHDEYNFCTFGLAVARQRTHDILQYILKPSFRNLDANWEHMSRSFVAGVAFYMPAVSFEVCVKYLCDILNVHVPRFTKKLSLWHSIMYRLTKFAFKYVLRIPGMLKLHNLLVFRAVKGAVEASPETLEKWKNKKFSYMKAETVVGEV